MIDDFDFGALSFGAMALGGLGVIAIVFAVVWRRVERMRERAPDPWDRYGH